MRRALSVKGNVSVNVDDTMVPTCTLFDASVSPFRTQGLSFTAYGNRTAVAGQLQSLALCPDLSSSIIVLDAIAVSNINAAFQTINFGPQEGASIAITPAQRAFSGELPGTNQSPPIGNVPLGVQPGTSGVSLIGRQIGRVTVLPSVTAIVPCGITVQPTQFLTFENDAVNQIIDITFFGRYYLIPQ